MALGVGEVVGAAMPAVLPICPLLRCTTTPTAAYTYAVLADSNAFQHATD